MAAASYDADVALHDVDYLVLGEGRDSIAGRARSLEDWIKLVRALLPKCTPLPDLSLRFKVRCGHSVGGRRWPIKMVSL